MKDIVEIRGSKKIIKEEDISTFQEYFGNDFLNEARTDTRKTTKEDSQEYCGPLDYKDTIAKKPLFLDAYVDSEQLGPVMMEYGGVMKKRNFHGRKGLPSYKTGGEIISVLIHPSDGFKVPYDSLNKKTIGPISKLIKTDWLLKGINRESEENFKERAKGVNEQGSEVNIFF